jgi:hypothetical protein
MTLPNTFLSFILSTCCVHNSTKLYILSDAEKSYWCYGRKKNWTGRIILEHPSWNLNWTGDIISVWVNFLVFSYVESTKLSTNLLIEWQYIQQIEHQSSNRMAIFCSLDSNWSRLTILKQAFKGFEPLYLSCFIR